MIRMYALRGRGGACPGANIDRVSGAVREGVCTARFASGAYI
jgi:hypothetical protein